ncbi:MAG: deoxyguanosinetriphosphate triphosphohydrolase [Hyphomicrobiales bacterium]|nr:deoxyguanosinetriphosphate triphosphohydrolase [Hyphomicrobiales bacterium]
MARGGGQGAGEAGCSARAAFACWPQHSRGRRTPEPDSPTRSPFQRDRDRIVHCTAFRRLKHKTQVFIYDEGDHYRTRLTHSLEVAQITRSLARTLRLDEDLAEALALAHDLGHPPFGHAGERALDAAMAPYGGFDHNAQSLRVVTRLERRYADFDGLNLTWEALEGLVKHNGPLTAEDGVPLGQYAATGLPHAIRAYQRVQDLELWSQPSLEAQIAAICDDIAYDSHDLDDGLRAGLFALEELADVPPVDACLAEVERLYPETERPRAVNEMLRRLITAMVDDVIAETGRNLDRLRPGTVEDVRRAGRGMAGFSAGLGEAERSLKAFLNVRVYRHERVERIMQDAQGIVAALVERYMADAGALPEAWRDGIAGVREDIRARRICDFIAGMTDRFAHLEHQRLFDATPELR